VPRVVTWGDIGWRSWTVRGYGPDTMSGPSPEAPGAEFCMQCGPGTALRPGDGGRVLVCPRCRWEREVPGRPLFVVTGASAAGKTTVTSALAKALPACDVFDVDVTLHVAALGWDVWRNTWLQLAHSIALNGRSTVLCGSLMPDQLSGLPARCLVGPLHFCTLDCPDEILAARLRARTAWCGFAVDLAV